MELELHLLKYDRAASSVEENISSYYQQMEIYIEDVWIRNERHSDMANIQNFLQKPGSYGSRLFDVTKHCLGYLCSFDMPPASYAEYMLDMWQCIMFQGTVGL